MGMQLRGILLGCLGVCWFLVTVAQAAPPEFTHKQARALTPQVDGQTLSLNTFTMGPDGNLWLCCGGSSAAPTAGKLLIMQPTGELVRTVALEFVPQAINFAPDGQSAFIAGSGMIARLDLQGQVTRSTKAPNLIGESEMKKKLEETQAAQLKQMLSVYDEQTTRLSEQLEKLNEQIAQAEEKADERALKRATARAKVVQQQLDSMKDVSKQLTESFSQAYAGDAVLDRVKRATAIAVTQRDVFVTLPSLQGYGYVLWRMNHDLEEAVDIKSDLSGCCGQLDIQTDGTDILVAENTSFRVARYDRDGKELGHFGQRGQGDAGSGWGSCCNPMNIRLTSNQEILVGESSIGHLKRYSKEGDYLGLIGTARIGGGCKHVALAVDPQRNWYFMMNQNSNNIAVLIPKDQISGETEEERDSRIAREGLGKKLLGAWEYQKSVKKLDNPAQSEQALGASLESYITQQYSYLDFQDNGQLNTTPPQPTASKENANGLGGLLSSVLGAVTGENPLVSLPAVNSTWEAIKQSDDQLQFVVLSEGVRGFGGTVTFVDDQTMQVQWYYDSPNSPYGAPLTYRRK